MDLRYPIGQFKYDGDPTPSRIEAWIKDIEETPALLRKAVADLRDQQLDTPYRPDGWTIRQVVHHLADSNLNGYIRFKLALTEDNPTIKPYREEKWAELSDSKLPIEVSLILLESLHSRWVALLRGLSPAELEMTFIHPDSGEVKLGQSIGNYAWHSQHHTAHITSLRERLGW